MTRTSSLIPRIIGAIIAAILFIAIAVMVLTPIQPFHLDVGLGGLTFIPVNDYLAAGAEASTMLWSYRIIDVLVQGLLLAAAAIGAAALFRLEQTKKEGKEE